MTTPNNPFPDMDPPERKPGEEGIARKKKALSMLSQWRIVYVRRAQRAMLRILLERGFCTMDDIREVVPIPKRINPKLFGAVPGALARAHIVISTGYIKTLRPCAHARALTKWAMFDSARACAWLEDKPELPFDHLGLLEDE